MTRIFSSLAFLAFSLLILNMALGLSIGDYNAAADRLLATQRQVQAVARSSDASPQAVAAAKRDLYALADQTQPMVRRAHWHMWLGIAAALVNVLVNSITITYFIGTTRWCREVVETYHLDVEYIRQSQSLKRRTFPWALGAILTILGIIALGGASDPSAVVHDSASWVAAHYTAALVGVGLIGFSFLVQARNMAENYRIINQIIAEVQRIRQTQGLAVE